MATKTIYERLKQHLSVEPAKSPIVHNDFDVYERPNLHLAIAEILQSPSCHSDLIGVVEYDYDVTLTFCLF